MIAIFYSFFIIIMNIINEGTALFTLVDVVVVVLLLEDVEGVVGGVGKLPCRYYPSISGDTPKLLLWYKEGDSKPVFR